MWHYLLKKVGEEVGRFSDSKPPQAIRLTINDEVGAYAIREKGEDNLMFLGVFPAKKLPHPSDTDRQPIVIEARDGCEMGGAEIIITIDHYNHVRARLSENSCDTCWAADYEYKFVIKSGQAGPSPA